MDSRILQEAALSYLAVYNEELREEMEDCGMILSEDYYPVDEAREPGVKPYRPNPTQAEVRADAAAARRRQMEAGKDKPGYGPEEKFKDWKDRSTPASTLKRKGGSTETVSQRMNREKPYAKRMTGPMAREYGSRTAAATTRAIRGPGEPQAVTMPRKQHESFDFYDVVLHHLISEGYADSVDSAEVIMANMSEDWIENIIEAKVDKGKSKEDKIKSRNLRNLDPDQRTSDSSTDADFRRYLHKRSRGE